MRDLRYAFRLIRRQPMFAALVIATLTLGIGAFTSMFSVVNGVLLKPLPYGDPDNLVWMYGAFRGSGSAAVAMRSAGPSASTPRRSPSSG